MSLTSFLLIDNFLSKAPEIVQTHGPAPLTDWAVPARALSLEKPTYHFYTQFIVVLFFPVLVSLEIPCTLCYSEDCADSGVPNVKLFDGGL